MKIIDEASDMKGVWLNERIANLEADRRRLEWLLDACEAAVKRGDWVVDGACDPDLESMRREFNRE